MGSPFFDRSPQRPGLDYTVRQLAILNDDIPIEEIRATELVPIIKKASERHDDMNLDIARGYYDQKMHPSSYTSPYTMEKAMEILQKLTPWEIHWG